MSEFFWPALVVMMIIAIAMIARPLLSADRRATAFLIALAIPLFTIAVYSYLGSPNIDSGRSMPIAATGAGSGSSQSPGVNKLASVASMLEGLAQRLEQNPNDGKGWLLLARSYKHLGQTNNAIAAYARAAALGEQDVDLSTLSNTRVPGMASDPSRATISGTLSLSRRAAEIVLPTDTVFIFARDASGSGIPAAVLQEPASELPIDFQLSDSNSMAGGTRLSDFDEVIVTARISRSGDATEALQELEAKTNLIAVTTSDHLNLIIN